jgi:hypothetical protein
VWSGGLAPKCGLGKGAQNQSRGADPKASTAILIRAAAKGIQADNLARRRRGGGRR